MNRCSCREEDLRSDFDDPCEALALVVVASRLMVPFHILPHLFRYCELRCPMAAGFKLRFKVRRPFLLFVFMLVIRIIGRRIASNVEGVRSVQVCCSQWHCRSVLDFHVQMRGWRKDSVETRSVCQGISALFSCCRVFHS